MKTDNEWKSIILNRAAWRAAICPDRLYGRSAPSSNAATGTGTRTRRNGPTAHHRPPNPPARQPPVPPPSPPPRFEIEVEFQGFTHPDVPGTIRAKASVISLSQIATAAYLDKLPHDIELLNFTGTREYISISTPMDGEFNANGEQLYSIYCDSRDRWWKVQDYRWRSTYATTRRPYTLLKSLIPLPSTPI